MQNLKRSLFLTVFLAGAFLIGLVGRASYAQDSGQLTNAEIDVLAAVENRWQTWLDDDFEGYLSTHHADWRRWSLRKSELEDRNSIEQFWNRAKANERTLSFRIEPTAIEIFDSGRFAVVHYVAYEKVRRLKERVAPSGRIVPIGNETTIPIRFSDFMISVGDKWYYVGGYRDGSCSLFHGFGRTCSE